MSNQGRMEEDFIPGRMHDLLGHFDPLHTGPRPEHPMFPGSVCEVEEVKASNEDFLETFAAPGRVGLVGGTSWIDRVIQKATQKVAAQRRQSRWSHAWIFQGRRRDGHHWVIESDLESGKKHRRLGVQENRIRKFFSEKECPNLAILDFGLNPDQVQRILFEGLELVANQASYSLLEILGTALAVNSGTSRKGKNLLAKDTSMYCSGMVQYVFAQAGLDLIPGVHPSLGTPEELARCGLIQKIYLLRR